MEKVSIGGSNRAGYFKSKSDRLTNISFIDKFKKPITFKLDFFFIISSISNVKYRMVPICSVFGKMSALADRLSVPYFALRNPPFLQAFKTAKDEI